MGLHHLRQILRTFFGLVPTLDLHGFGVRDALTVTEHFVRDAAARGETVVRLVYGKGRGSPGGRGVLRDVIPHWLDHDGAAWVERYERLPDATGADGSVKVWLRTRPTAAVDSDRPVP